MPYQPPSSGPQNTAEYMTSGLPWVTSSNVTDAVWQIDFPYVTNEISVHATSGSLRLGFTRHGVNGSNYLLLQSSDSWLNLDVRCKSVFLRNHVAGTGSVTLFAGMTLIDQTKFPVLTGSAVYNSASIAHEFGYGYSGSVGGGTGLG